MEAVFFGPQLVNSSKCSGTIGRLAHAKEVSNNLSEICSFMKKLKYFPCIKGSS